MVYEIKNAVLSVKIDSLGAEIISVKDREETEYIWQGNPELWEEHAPNLFPYIARLTKGTYTYRGKEYHMKIHGIAKYKEFHVKKAEEQELLFELCSDETTKEQYPFDFRFFVHYRLNGSRLEITCKVANEDSRTLFFGLGGHPGFIVPLEEGLDFTDYRLEFQEECTPERIEFTEDCYLTGRKSAYPLENGKEIRLTHALFDRDAIVLEHTPGCVCLCSEKGKKAVRVSYPDMRYIGFWHAARTEAKYVCIEPWSSLPSRKDIVENIEEQDSLLRLEAGKVYENRWSIEIFG